MTEQNQHFLIQQSTIRRIFLVFLTLWEAWRGLKEILNHTGSLSISDVVVFLKPAK